MKKTIAGLIVLMCCVATANAADELIPESMDLGDMPKDTRVIVKKPFSMKSGRHIDLPGETSIFTMNDYATDHQKGDVCKRGAYWPGATERAHYFICERGSFAVRMEGRDSSAGAFRKAVGDYFELVSSDPSIDPYAGMDRSIVLELLMAKITTAMKANKHEEALPHFARLEKLGTPLPESFYYYYIQALGQANQKLDAKTRATNYLTTYGNKGKYYAKVIELLAEL
jgi:hypothetical protein